MSKCICCIVPIGRPFTGSKSPAIIWKLKEK
jgi:hypothetical protein